MQHCISLLAMSTCYFSSLMILSAQRIGLTVTWVNPVTSTGAERLFLDLAADFLQTFLFGPSANSDLTRGKSCTIGLSHTFFSVLIRTKFTMLAVIESLVKGMKKNMTVWGCMWAGLVSAYHMLSWLFVLFQQACPPPKMTVTTGLNWKYWWKYLQKNPVDFELMHIIYWHLVM